MSTQLRTQAKVPSTPKPSLSSVQTQLLQRKCACGGSPGIDGECVECRNKRLGLQRSGRNATGSSTLTAPSIVHDVLRSSAQALDATTRSYMEPRFGYDFSQVRVHANEKAAESARSVNALAYTVGRNVVFGEGQYALGTNEGKRLLAHELTHVVQQSNNTHLLPDRLEIGDSGTGMEREADRIAQGIVSGSALHSGQATPSVTSLRLQRVCPRAPTHIGRTPSSEPCTRRSAQAVSGSLLYFCLDSTELEAGQETWLSNLLVDVRMANRIEIHGNASTEGPKEGDYNYNLACKRAATLAQKFRSAGVTAPIVLFTHGPTSAYGEARFNRNVVVVPICSYSLADAPRIELAGARATLEKSARTAREFTFFGLTGRGTLERVAIDHKYWFAKLYELITWHEIADRDKFQHPSFLLHFIPIFYDMYYNALRHYLNKQFDQVSERWVKHFRMTDRHFAESFNEYLNDITESIVTGVSAHIEGDMEEALVEAFRIYVAKYCLANASLNDFRRDFFETNRAVFAKVQASFLAELARGGPSPLPVEQGQLLLNVGQRATGKGLDIEIIYQWRAKAWAGALQELGKKR